MTSQTSGNGVKVAKLIKEIESIINDNTISYPAKCKILSEIKTEGRPGKSEADELIRKFSVKLRYYTRLNQRIKDFREYNTFEKRARFRLEKENKSNKIVSEIVKMVVTDDEYKKFKNHYYNFKFFEIKHRMKDIIFYMREQAKLINEREEKIKYFVSETGLSKQFYNTEKNILEVQNNKASNAYNAKKMYAKFGKYYITVTQEESEDWGAYSKGWHKAHGPRRTIESRDINFYKNGKLESSVSVNSFAGNYLINAIISKFNLQKIKVSKELKKVQLIDEAEVVLIRQILSTKIYERRLAGVHLDYCVVHKNETFHAQTVEKTIAGLQNKIKAEKYFEREMISKEDGFKLGFCESGMKSFCEDNNVDFEGQYSRKDLRNIVIKSRALNCEKYNSELKKIGILLNCK